MQTQSEILDCLPPSDVEAEQRLLYAMIAAPRCIDDVALTLVSGDFYDHRHQRLFAALVANHSRDRGIDAPRLIRSLKESGELEAAGGAAYVAEILSLPSAVTTTAGAHAKTILDCSRRRAVIQAATEMLQAGWRLETPIEETLEAAEAALGRVRTGTPTEVLVDGPTAAIEFTDRVEAIMHRGEHCGLMTGLWKFDEVFGGLFPGEYVVLAADSSAGKTSLGCQIADYVASRGKLVYVASLEMESGELAQRLICSIAEVNSRAVRTGRIQQEDMTKLAAGAERFSRRTIRIDPRTDLKVSDIRRASRRLLRDGLALVVVDYLGLIEPDDYRASREQQVARISRGLKNLAKELKVPVMAMCQLNRDKMGNERPTLRNLRESGAIGNDAHMVLFLHKPADGIEDTIYETFTKPDGREGRKKQIVRREWPAELILAKNRNGDTGTVRLDWHGQYTRFSCWDIPQNMDNYEPAFEQNGGDNVRDF